MNDILKIFKVVQGDITKLTVDAIVNAANSSLLGGGGVDGAIHRAGGPEIVKECKLNVAKKGGCNTGEAVITTAGKLPARYVIHTVGPIWSGGRNGEEKLLANCYKNSLKLAVENNCRSIAFPNISAGVYGYPKSEAAVVAFDAVTDFLRKDDSLEEVVFVCFDDENFQLANERLSYFLKG